MLSHQELTFWLTLIASLSRNTGLCIEYALFSYWTLILVEINYFCVLKRFLRLKAIFQLKNDSFYLKNIAFWVGNKLILHQLHKFASTIRMCIINLLLRSKECFKTITSNGKPISCVLYKKKIKNCILKQYAASKTEIWSQNKLISSKNSASTANLS